MSSSEAKGATNETKFLYDINRLISVFRTQFGPLNKMIKRLLQVKGSVTIQHIQRTELTLRTKWLCPIIDLYSNDLQ
jgi:hypothetical protein